jgi:hypothetical protein
LIIAASRRRRIVPLLAVLGSALSSAPAQAETGSPSAPRAAPVAALLHDDRAISEWLKQRHHDVLAAEARMAQARADLGSARLPLPNPQLDFTLGGLGVGKPNPTLDKATQDRLNFGNTSNYSVGITQTIELGKRGARTSRWC